MNERKLEEQLDSVSEGMRLLGSLIHERRELRMVDVVRLSQEAADDTANKVRIKSYRFRAALQDIHVNEMRSMVATALIENLDAMVKAIGDVAVECVAIANTINSTTSEDVKEI